MVTPLLNLFDRDKTSLGQQHRPSSSTATPLSMSGHRRVKNIDYDDDDGYDDYEEEEAPGVAEGGTAGGDDELTDEDRGTFLS